MEKNYIETKLFEYGETQINYLKKADKKLGAAIDRIGKIERVVIPDLFTALVRSIVSQQISLKAAATVFARLQSRLGEISPRNIMAHTVEEMKECGLSLRKVGYIRGIAEKVISGELNLEELKNMSDEEVIKRLSALNGIGRWTAEMLLINSMERPDIVSWGDIAIRRGMCRLYGLEELTREQFNIYRARYSPYGSVASLYLWRVAHGE
jgi:DNA-3-methyladenine glycosylase II